jgi:hypothetical protein
MLWTLLGVGRKDRVGPRTGPGGRVLKTPEEQQRGKGTGNWACWQPAEAGRLHEAAACWARQLPPGDRYWLCWNVNDDWCRVQQRLVREAGWTPLVGADANVANPTVLDGSVRLDFNAALGLPSLWMHFPLELAFGWVERLAFWHSDVLLPRPVLRTYARQFEELRGPVTAAVFNRRNLFRPRGWNNAARWFEVVGCTTRAASLSQFEHGCGWWRHFQNHPNAAEVRNLDHYHWDHGGGIRYWERACGGTVQRLRMNSNYHFTGMANREVHRLGTLHKGDALRQSSLLAIADSLGIRDLVD